MSDRSVLATADAKLQGLGVPEGPMVDAVRALARMCDAPDVPGHLAPASAALAAALRWLREQYEPRSPLEIELDIARGERYLRELRSRGGLE